MKHSHAAIQDVLLCDTHSMQENVSPPLCPVWQVNSSAIMKWLLLLLLAALTLPWATQELTYPPCLTPVLPPPDCVRAAGARD